MTNKLDNLTKEQLIEYINGLRKQLNNEKYGLYFDRKVNPEDIIEFSKSEIPILKKEIEFSINRGSTNNLLIEGDNFQALTSLNLVSGTDGYIDIIYIDPPYNTGNKDFIYNDRFVDREDGYRHTKWLNFMEKRLRLSRDLLKEDGVIFISIDDNEVAQLKLLCDSIFGELNFIGVLPRVTKKSGKGHSGNIAKNHDYVLIYSKDLSSSKFAGLAVDDDDYPFEDEFVSTRGKYKLNQPLDYDSLWYNPAMDFPLNINDEIFYPGGDKNAHDERHNGNHKSKDWVWRWGLQKFKFGYQNGFVVIKDGRNGKRIYTKTYLNATIKKMNSTDYKVDFTTRQTNISSIAFVDNIYSNDNAKKELDKVGITFDFPKPSSLIKTLISIVDNKNAVVADFFAGSGTTAQAVLDLNKEDGGNRKFILCTNNEGNIMTDVCYPRIKTIITGIRKDGSKYSDGVDTNLVYFKIDFVNANTSKDQVKYNLVQEVDSLICIAEDSFKEVELNDKYGIYSNIDGSKITIIYRDFYDKNDFDKFTQFFDNNETKRITFYQFSTDNTIDENVFISHKNVVVKPIPNKIFEIYKAISEDIKRNY